MTISGVAGALHAGPLSINYLTGRARLTAVPVDREDRVRSRLAPYPERHARPTLDQIDLDDFIRLRRERRPRPSRCDACRSG